MTQYRVLYEDEALLFIDKASGLPSQPSATPGVTDLYTLLSKRYRALGQLHRLDQPTSGVMVFTLDPRANKPLTEAFRTQQVRKTYLALVAGLPAPEGTWDRPLDDKNAVTRWKTLASTSGVSALEMYPSTGRTHQLRRHAAAVNHPILGDRRYGGAHGYWLPRLALHAYRLELVHPLTGEALSISAPLPPPLKGAWATAGGPER